MTEIRIAVNFYDITMVKEPSNLLDMMLEHATAFLNSAAEFYPFGGTINMAGDIIPLAASTGNNYPESSEILTLLEVGIADKFSNQQIKAAAIVSDTDFRENKDSKLVQAIKIKLMTSNSLYDEHYYLYTINNKIVVIYQHIIYTDKVLLSKPYSN